MMLGISCLMCGAGTVSVGTWTKRCSSEACRFEWSVFWDTGEIGYWAGVWGKDSRDVFVDVPRGCLMVVSWKEC